MAFSTAEKLSISRIVGVTPTLLTAQLTALGASLTSDVEDAVRTELERDEAVREKFTVIHPGPESFFADIDPERVKNDIRINIARYLEMNTSIVRPVSGVGTVQIT